MTKNIYTTKVTIGCLVDPSHDNHDEYRDDELDEDSDGDNDEDEDQDGSCLVNLCHRQPPTLQKPRCAAIVR